MGLLDRLNAAAAEGRSDDISSADGTSHDRRRSVGPVDGIDDPPSTGSREVKHLPAGGGADEDGGGRAGAASGTSRRKVPPAELASFDRRSVDRPPQEAWDRMKTMVRTMLREELAPTLGRLSPSEVEVETRKTLTNIIEREQIRITPIQRQTFVRQLMSELLGLGPLDDLLADPSVTEIMCNRFSEIWIERDGQLTLTDVTFSSEEQYRSVIQRIVNAVGRRIDESSPMVDARLSDGSRVNVIVPPLALDGAVITIRKFPDDALTAYELIDRGIYTESFAYFMRAAVQAGLNILVSGGTGSGKTTTLNILSSFIPLGERIITIEDSAELQLQQPHVIRLESRPSNAEGVGEVSIRDLVRNALRMRPNRLILGECRGGESLDLLQAINTGHNGSMATVHSNSARDAVKRLETMVLMAGYDLPLVAIREQIASALHLLVHVERLPSGERIIGSVSEIQGTDGDVMLIQDVMTHTGGPDGRILPVGLRPKVADRMAAAGCEMPSEIFRKGELSAEMSSSAAHVDGARS